MKLTEKEQALKLKSLLERMDSMHLNEISLNQQLRSARQLIEAEQATVAKLNQRISKMEEADMKKS